MSEFACEACGYRWSPSEVPAQCPLCGAAEVGEAGRPAMELDEADRRLLNALQEDFPLVERPFEVLGARLGLSESDVIARVGRMKAGVIRQISAIFDSAGLGYKSTLAAFEVEPEGLERAAAVVSAHPGCSHNYRREHRFNLWFTLTLHRSVPLEEEVARLAAEAGAIRSILLPTVRMFKIGVKLDATGERDVTRQEEGPKVRRRVAARDLTPREIEAVRALQRDLPIEERPFEALAANCVGDLSGADLRAYAGEFRESGVMRRFSAVLRHHDAGFSANAMGVWIVPEERIEEVGERMARFAAVTHCYQRPTYPPDWPYNVFTMVHARTVEECGEVLAAISRETGVTDYARLFSTKEYKKVRVRYFEP